MKKLLLCSTLASALFATVPAMGAEAPPATPPAAPQSDVVDALTLAAKDLRTALGDGKGNPIPLLDKMAAYEFPEATREKLIKVFGQARPVTVARVPAPKGKVAFDVALQAHAYRDNNGTNFQWTPLSTQLLLDAAGRNMDGKGSWAQLDIAGKEVSARLSDLALVSKHRRNADDIWLGKSRIEIAKVAIGATDKEKSKDALMTMDELVAQSVTTQRGKVYAVSSDFRIKSIAVAGQQIDGLRLSARINNVDLKAFEAMSRAMGAQGEGVTPEKQLDAMLPSMKAFARNAAARGTTIEIDDFSAGYRGHRATIRGRLMLAKAADADFDSMKALANKIIARFDIKVPVALIGEVAGSVVAKQANAQAAAQGGAPLTPEAARQAGQSFTDVIVGKALNGGFARLEKGVLVSSIEFKGGKLSVNGKPMALPTLPPKPPAAK